jgi:two-component system nitrogen regulation sensor histidine kinase GlnL
VNEAVLDSLPFGVLVVADGAVRSANVRASELLAASATRLRGRPLDEVLSGALPAVQRVLQGAATCTARDVRNEGFGVAAELLRITASRGPEPGQVVVVLQPAEQEAVAAFQRRLAWLDRLAAGMAHEIRNPLGGIRGAAQLLARSPDAPGRDELTAMIIRDADRIDYQVERLMGLCRPRPMEPGPVLLNRLLHAEVDRLQRQFSGVAFVMDLDPSLPAIEADARRLQEVFGNLLRNAAEAARSRVRLTSRIDSDGRLVGGGERGLTLRVDVEDDGEGISPERREALFAPFDTTKPDGHGLGLFLARLAIEDHGGLIQVDPRPGRGARFTVRLAECLPARPTDAAPSWAERGVGSEP